MKLNSYNRALFGGNFFAAFFVFMVASFASFYKLYEFVTLGVMILTPIIAGIITISFATEEQVTSRRYVIVSPWLGILFWAVIGLVVEYESLVCVAILAPFYAVLSSVGGLIGAWISARLNGRISSRTMSCFVLLPLMISPIEGSLGNSTQIRSVVTEISINRAASDIWPQIISVPPISENELDWRFSYSIGIPKPISACTPSLAIGKTRDIKWEKDITFTERITGFKENQSLEYEVEVDPSSLAMKRLDGHVVIGDKYFDILNGSYEISNIGSTSSLVKLTTVYRISTKVNFYGIFWADIVLNDLHSSILKVIKDRAEGDLPKKSCINL